MNAVTEPDTGSWMTPNDARELLEPDELDDLAAELDHAELAPAEADADGGYGDTDAAAGFTGVCAGGPYHGRVMVARFPRGFLLVDRPSNQAWVYDYNGTAFILRADYPMTLDGQRRWQAADGEDFDVIAYDTEQVPR